MRPRRNRKSSAVVARPPGPWRLQGRRPAPSRRDGAASLPATGAPGRRGRPGRRPRRSAPPVARGAMLAVAPLRARVVGPHPRPPRRGRPKLPRAPGPSSALRSATSSTADAVTLRCCPPAPSRGRTDSASAAPAGEAPGRRQVAVGGGHRPTSLPGRSALGVAHLAGLAEFRPASVHRRPDGRCSQRQG